MIETAEFIDNSLIKVSWTSTILLGLISVILFNNKNKINGLWLNLVLLLVVIIAFINLSYKVNKPVYSLPYYCYLRVIDGTYRRNCVLLFFIIQLLSSITFCIIQSIKSNKATTIQRKFFHLTISLIALIGILYEPEFTRLSAHLMVQIFIILELLRRSNCYPWNEYLNKVLPLFIDPLQESEELILTPILLISGIFLPLLLSPVIYIKGYSLYLYHFVGISTVGVGDSFAAIIGSKYGKTKLSWPFRRHKSFEGTLAMFISQVIFYFFILYFDIVNYNSIDLIRLSLAIITSTLIEAASKIGDNILLPFIAWIIL